MYAFFMKPEEIMNELLLQLRRFNTPERRAEFLENALKKNPPQEVRKDVCLMLAQIYEGKKWFANAARYYKDAADVAKTFKERIVLHFKEGQMYLKSREYGVSDAAFKRAADAANLEEKQRLKKKVFELYMQEVEYCEKNKRHTVSIEILKRLIYSDRVDITDKNAVIERIANNYDIIGKPHEANEFRRMIK